MFQPDNNPAEGDPALEVIDKIDEIRAILGNSSIEAVQFSFKKIGDLTFERAAQGFEITFVPWARGGSRDHRAGKITIDSETGRVDVSGRWKNAFTLRDLIEMAQAATPVQIRHCGDFLKDCSFPEQ